MKMELKKCIHKIVSLMLAAVMMVSVFSVAVPQKAEAATATLSLKGSGKSNVKITDANCYTTTKKSNYIKFKSNVNGYVTLTFGNNSKMGEAMGFVTFCNSKKRALGRNSEYFDTNAAKPYQRTRTYGVKKGTTYYIKIESAGGVKVAANVKAVNKKAGTKRGNAKTLSKGKKAEGYIVAGSKAADWYKIKLTKQQKLKFYYSAKTNGAVLMNSGSIDCYNGIKFTLYDGKGKPFISGVNNYDFANLLDASPTQTYFLESQYTGKKSGLKPGTYYMKVERYNSTSSGYYSLKWK